MYYFADGDYEYNESCGGVEVLRAEVDKIHQKGARLGLYLEGYGVSPLSAVGKGPRAGMDCARPQG